MAPLTDAVADGAGRARRDAAAVGAVRQPVAVDARRVRLRRRRRRPQLTARRGAATNGPPDDVGWS